MRTLGCCKQLNRHKLGGARSGPPAIKRARTPLYDAKHRDAVPGTAFTEEVVLFLYNRVVPCTETYPNSI